MSRIGLLWAAMLLGFSFAFVATVGLHAQQASIPSDLEIPSGISIAPPGSSAPKEMAGFSGMWVGLWNGGRSTALIVTAVKGDAVDCRYCWGKSPDAWVGTSYRGSQPGCLET